MVFWWQNALYLIILFESPYLRMSHTFSNELLDRFMLFSTCIVCYFIVFIFIVWTTRMILLVGESLKNQVHKLRALLFTRTHTTDQSRLIFRCYALSCSTPGSIKYHFQLTQLCRRRCGEGLRHYTEGTAREAVSIFTRNGSWAQIWSQHRRNNALCVTTVAFVSGSGVMRGASRLVSVGDSIRDLCTEATEIGSSLLSPLMCIVCITILHNFGVETYALF